MDQSIPQDLVDSEKLHKIDLRGKSDYNSLHKHRRWIQMWNDRENYVVNGLPNTYTFAKRICDQSAPPTCLVNSL
ncbi:hypothetical protein Lal_00030151 [Lupinus albus]|nr:hypothetical protein Lal_00030151 [Lupinus albus]